jgi:hypothetical protein
VTGVAASEVKSGEMRSPESQALGIEPAALTPSVAV